MAKLVAKDGPIMIQQAVNDDLEKVVLIQLQVAPKLELTKKHAISVPMADKDMKFVSTELSEAAQAALKLLMEEISSTLKKKARDKAVEVCKEMGIKLDD